MAPTPDEMGHCDNVYLTEVGDTQVVVFKHGKSLFVKSTNSDQIYPLGLLCVTYCFLRSLTEKEDGAISTVVIRGSTDNLMDDIERAVDDGVNTFKVLVRVSNL